MCPPPANDADQSQDVVSGESPLKFALFSGHDTVIAPLLASLGAYDCLWPPYASYLAFELWTKPERSADRPKRRALQEENGESEPGTSAAGVGKMESLPPHRDEGKEEGNEAYVRMTFNGKPVTHHITDCENIDE